MGELIYKTVLKCKSNFSFDEGNAGKCDFFNICYQHGIKVFYSPYYLDISMSKFDFSACRDNRLQNISGVYFDHGKLTYQCADGKTEEIVYAHFQSRKMRDLLDKEICKSFYVFPNVIQEQKTYVADESQVIEFDKTIKRKKMKAKMKRIYRACELLLMGKIFSPKWRKIAIGRSE